MPYLPIIIIVYLSWGAVIFGFGMLLRERKDRLVMLGLGLFAALLAATLSLQPPVVSTYTGLGHVETAMRLASLDWWGEFSPDYPFSMPALASVFMFLVEDSLFACRLASVLLFRLGAIGTYLLTLRI